MTFHIPLKRKLDVDLFLTKDLVLKICRTEGMSDIIVTVFRKLSPLKHHKET